MAMRIVNGKLTGVPFCTANAAGGKLSNPTLIVIHDTAQSKIGGAVSWFTSDACNTSAHIVVERNGSITQLVKFNQVAYHAGKSSWNDRSGCNVFSIGIEIVNPGMMQRRGDEVVLVYKVAGAGGKVVDKIVERFPVADCQEVNTKEHGRGWCLPYTPEQTAAVAELCKALVSTYPSISEIVTHWQVSPRRKVDTNPLYPLDELRAAVFAEPSTNAEPVATSLVDDEPEEEKAGLLSERNFAKVNDLANKGSRVADAIREMKRFLLKWLGGGAAAGGAGMTLLDPKKGTGSVLHDFIVAHPILCVLGAAIVVGALIAGAAYVYIKRVERGLVTAAAEGRYRPRGG